LAGRAYFKEKCRRPDRALQQLELALDAMTRFIVFLVAAADIVKVQFGTQATETLAHSTVGSTKSENKHLPDDCVV
jgi:hypothetical protein